MHSGTERGYTFLIFQREGGKFTELSIRKYYHQYYASNKQTGPMFTDSTLLDLGPDLIGQDT